MYRNNNSDTNNSTDNLLLSTDNHQQHQNRNRRPIILNELNRLSISIDSVVPLTHRRHGILLADSDEQLLEHQQRLFDFTNTSVQSLNNILDSYQENQTISDTVSVEEIEPAAASSSATTIWCDLLKSTGIHLKQQKNVHSTISECDTHPELWFHQQIQDQTTAGQNSGRAQFYARFGEIPEHANSSVPFQPTETSPHNYNRPIPNTTNNLTISQLFTQLAATISTTISFQHKQFKFLHQQLLKYYKETISVPNWLKEVQTIDQLIYITPNSHSIANNSSNNSNPSPAPISPSTTATSTCNIAIYINNSAISAVKSLTTYLIYKLISTWIDEEERPRSAPAAADFLLIYVPPKIINNNNDLLLKYLQTVFKYKTVDELVKQLLLQKIGQRLILLYEESADHQRLGKEEPNNQLLHSLNSIVIKITDQQQARSSSCRLHYVYQPRILGPFIGASINDEDLDPILTKLTELSSPIPFTRRTAAGSVNLYRPQLATTSKDLMPTKITKKSQITFLPNLLTQFKVNSNSALKFAKLVYQKYFNTHHNRKPAATNLPPIPTDNNLQQLRFNQTELKSIPTKILDNFLIKLIHPKKFELIHPAVLTPQFIFYYLSTLNLKDMKTVLLLELNIQNCDDYILIETIKLLIEQRPATILKLISYLPVEELFKFVDLGPTTTTPPRIQQQGLITTTTLLTEIITNPQLTIQLNTSKDKLLENYIQLLSHPNCPIKTLELKITPTQTTTPPIQIMYKLQYVFQTLTQFNQSLTKLILNLIIDPAEFNLDGFSQLLVLNLNLPLLNSFEFSLLILNNNEIVLDLTEFLCNFYKFLCTQINLVELILTVEFNMTEQLKILLDIIKNETKINKLVLNHCNISEIDFESVVNLSSLELIGCWTTSTEEEEEVVFNSGTIKSNQSEFKCYSPAATSSSSTTHFKYSLSKQNSPYFLTKNPANQNSQFKYSTANQYSPLPSPNQLLFDPIVCSTSLKLPPFLHRLNLTKTRLTSFDLHNLTTYLKSPTTTKLQILVMENSKLCDILPILLTLEYNQTLIELNLSSNLALIGDNNLRLVMTALSKNFMLKILSIGKWKIKIEDFSTLQAIQNYFARCSVQKLNLTSSCIQINKNYLPQAITSGSGSIQNSSTSTLKRSVNNSFKLFKHSSSTRSSTMSLEQPQAGKQYKSISQVSLNLTTLIVENTKITALEPQNGSKASTAMIMAPSSALVYNQLLPLFQLHSLTTLNLNQSAPNGIIATEFINLLKIIREKVLKLTKFTINYQIKPKITASELKTICKLIPKLNLIELNLNGFNIEGGEENNNKILMHSILNNSIKLNVLHWTNYSQDIDLYKIQNDINNLIFVYGNNNFNVKRFVGFYDDCVKIINYKGDNCNESIINNCVKICKRKR